MEDLHIDVVLLSHTHYDHLDEGTARRIGDRALWYIHDFILYLQAPMQYNSADILHINTQGSSVGSEENISWYGRE